MGRAFGTDRVRQSEIGSVYTRPRGATPLFPIEIMPLLLDQLMRYEVEKREKTISELKSDIDCLKIDMTKLDEAKKTVTSRLVYAGDFFGRVYL